MGGNRPEVNLLTGVLGTVFYIINDLEKIDVWVTGDVPEIMISL
jgi:hypothetical protein